MSWYKTGTVNVTNNSNAVIGTGTAFISNSRVGDAFRGPDGNWYEVTNIASDTAMSILPVYQGSSDGSGLYAIAPMQGYVKDSADALRAASLVIGNSAVDLTEKVEEAKGHAERSESASTAAKTSELTVTQLAQEVKINTAASSASAQSASSSATTAGLYEASVLSNAARFLTPKTQLPTTRDDGSSLVIGDRVLLSTTGIEYIYKSTGWAANNLDAQELSSESGASQVGAVGYTTVQEGMDAILALSNLRDVVFPEEYGAQAGDSDNTVAINAMIEDAVAKGKRIDGRFRTYGVTTVKLKSKLHMNNIFFESVGYKGAPGDQARFQPVIESDGITTPVTDMLLVNVSANGRRDLLVTGVWVGAGEDGGMHAWRIVGGFENNILVNPVGINSGTHGLFLSGRTTPDLGIIYRIKNNKIFNPKFTGNRAIGFACDSIDGLYIGPTGDTSGNGLDLNTTDPLIHGNRGYRDSNGKLSGMPFDIEAYLDTPGSGFKNITIEGLNCTGCAIHATVYDPRSAISSGFAIHENIRFINCVFDQGVASSSDRPVDTNYPFKMRGYAESGVKPFSNVFWSGCTFKQTPYIKGLSKGDMSGGFITAQGGSKCIIVDSDNFWPTAPSNAVRATYTPEVAITAVKNLGNSTGVSIVNRVVEPVSGGLDMLLSVQLLGITAGPDIVYTFSAPAGYFFTKFYMSSSSLDGGLNKSRWVINSDGTATIRAEVPSSGNILILDIGAKLSPAG